MVDAGVDRWETFSADLERSRRAVLQARTTHIGSSSLRNGIRKLVQEYFREIRPELEASQIAFELIGQFDEQMQRLLRLANQRNRRTTYVRALRDAIETRQEIELERELRMSQLRSRLQRADRSAVEQAILQTLERLAPAAALSYEQALNDLNDATRISYKGTAHELRETLREVLGHLAPDDEVTADPGFKPEKNRTQPTHRQKVEYILKRRGLSRRARPAVGSANLIDQLVASITRATYERGSLAAHVAQTRGEVQQLKMYVDTVLGELLEIHQQ